MAALAIAPGSEVRVGETLVVTGSAWGVADVDVMVEQYNAHFGTVSTLVPVTNNISGLSITPNHPGIITITADDGTDVVVETVKVYESA